ncbi:MAG: hypothetical protein K2Q06_08770, partial [Parvularculaceae bacterium]|nr:hypothetical protein [Parvularculaceae bacterium]
RATLSPDIREYEDPGALFGGDDGLSAYRAILDDLPRIAAPDGLVVFELGAGLAASVEAMARQAFPAAAVAIDRDLGGRERALILDLSATSP